MSVNIEQVRDILASAITPREDVWRKMMREMADEIEAFRTLLERAQGVVDMQYSLYEDEDMLELSEAIDKVLGGTN